MSMSKISLAVLALASTSTALQPIRMKGQKLFYENGTQFFMKGIAYQEDQMPGGGTPEDGEFIDPLSNERNCRRDVPLLEELGVNIIRTYALNYEANHDACMELLNEAGIYVITDLSQPLHSIERTNPTWNLDLYDRYRAVIDDMSQYDNVVGFFAGNEVTNDNTNTPASAYVKAAVRDMKAYIADTKDRWMGVGYANNDDPDIVEDIAHYFNCGTREESVDLWGYNIYSWCGESTLERSRYNAQADFFSDYGVPVFFAEYGCTELGREDRIWQETGVLYEEPMTDVFSGGLAFKFQQDSANFGVVTIDEDGSFERSDDFERLAEQHNTHFATGVSWDDYDPDFETNPECPAQSEDWRVSAVLPPTPNRELCECAEAASTCGLAGRVTANQTQEIFDTICGDVPEACAGINHNATTGVYGTYSMCDNSHKLAYVLGMYYEIEGRDDACDFNGLAEIKDNTAEDSCSDALESAAAHNSEAATATAGTRPTDGAGGGDSDDDDEPSFGVSGFSMTRMFALGDVAVGLYMAVAAGAGAAMIML